jgi:adenosylhomocysteine nucleosidase
LVENKSTADSSGSQNFATLNVAKYSFGLIDFVLTINNVKDNKKIDKSKIALILKAASKLYPAGIKENSIWERAGGE